MATGGRPRTPLDPTSSNAAFLGAELRARRRERGLTRKALGDQIDFSPQHVSEVERAKTTPTEAFVAAVDRALEADGALERLLPPVLQDREKRRQERAEARREAARPSLRCDEATHSDVTGDENVQPTNRRGLLGAGAAAALGVAGVAAASDAPAAARQVDPELTEYWSSLLRLLARHEAAFGPHQVLDTVQRELRRIAACREVAHGELRTELMRVEASWAGFAMWLSNDTGDVHSRNAWTKRALRLAEEADYPDMAAFVRSQLTCA